MRIAQGNTLVAQWGAGARCKRGRLAPAGPSNGRTATRYETPSSHPLVVAFLARCSAPQHLLVAAFAVQRGPRQHLRHVRADQRGPDITTPATTATAATRERRAAQRRHPSADDHGQDAEQRGLERGGERQRRAGAGAPACRDHAQNTSGSSSRSICPRSR